MDDGGGDDLPCSLFLTKSMPRVKHTSGSGANEVPL